MLKEKILSTLKFFDLQDIPLTLFELHKFLLNEKTEMRQQVDAEFEFIESPGRNQSVIHKVTLDQVLLCLEGELKGQVVSKNGYYCLPGRTEIIDCRLNNYFYGFKREKRIKRYAWFLKYIPFVRGVAVGGSQALGQQKEQSDIDLLITTDSNFMWLARTLVSVYFQIFGVRRYKNKTENRFCLNHYLARPKVLDRERNMYKAMEYLRLRPVIYPEAIFEFQKNNLNWLKLFFPNFEPVKTSADTKSKIQSLQEKIFNNSFGVWLENVLKNLETKRIKQDRYTFITPDELSFHPESRHNSLLQQFFN